VIKHGPEKRPFLKDLIPCLHFSENFKNLENLGGVKLKHLLEIQNTDEELVIVIFLLLHNAVIGGGSPAAAAAASQNDCSGAVCATRRACVWPRHMQSAPL
jgi:hypothetical protein